MRVGGVFESIVSGIRGRFNPTKGVSARVAIGTKRSRPVLFGSCLRMFDGAPLIFSHTALCHAHCGGRRRTGPVLPVSRWFSDGTKKMSTCHQKGPGGYS